MIKWCTFNIKDPLQFTKKTRITVVPTQLSVSESAVDRVLEFADNLFVPIPKPIEDPNP